MFAGVFLLLRRIQRVPFCSAATEAAFYRDIDGKAIAYPRMLDK